MRFFKFVLSTLLLMKEDITYSLKRHRFLASKPRWLREVDRMRTYTGAADILTKSGKPRQYKERPDAWELPDRMLPLSWDPYED